VFAIRRRAAVTACTARGPVKVSSRAAAATPNGNECLEKVVMNRSLLGEKGYGLLSRSNSVRRKNGKEFEDYFGWGETTGTLPWKNARRSGNSYPNFSRTI
jgi:hypothetical protein